MAKKKYTYYKALRTFDHRITGCPCIKNALFTETEKQKRFPKIKEELFIKVKRTTDEFYWLFGLRFDDVNDT